MGICDPHETQNVGPRLDLIYSTAPIGLAFLSTDCRYVMINERLTEICGISVDGHIGRTVRETVPQVAEQVERIVQTIVQTGEPITGVEVNGQRPDGSNIDRVWITYWHPLKNCDGEIIGINVAAEEITERKRTETELAASQERLRSLNRTLADRVEAQAQERDRVWNLSQDLLIVSDATNGSILNVNPAWSSTLGWSLDDLIGKNVQRFVHLSDRDRLLAERTALVAGQNTRHFENRILCKDGSYRWLSWFAVSEHGVVYAAGRDVTDIKRSQEQLHALRQQLAEVTRRTTMDAMATSIVHEIKQPLAAIIMNANTSLRWLERPSPDLAAARDALNRIVKDGHRTNEVIAGIRAMFGRQSRETAPVNLHLLVKDVLALVRGELENHNILLCNRISDSLPPVMAAQVQLQQVIFNIATNAIEAMMSVTGRDRRLTFQASLDNHAAVTLTIEDTGCGIDPVHIDRIFDPLFTTKSDGMGLGLAICRSIVEGHGGRLQASSRDPFGTAFHLTLPIIACFAQEQTTRAIAN